MQRREFKYFNQRDELVARCVMSACRTEREAGKEIGKYMSIPKARYYRRTRFEAIDADVAAEEVRGKNAALLGGRRGRTIRSSRSCADRLTVADMIAWMMGIGSPHIR